MLMIQFILNSRKRGLNSGRTHIRGYQSYMQGKYMGGRANYTRTGRDVRVLDSFIILIVMISCVAESTRQNLTNYTH